VPAAGPKTILVVDDEVEALVLFRRAAVRAGVELNVEEASSGEAAIAFLGELAANPSRPIPALVLLDLKMPRVTGFEVLEWLRGQPGLRRIPVVVFTSSAQSSDINRAYDLGANSYLVKPVNYQALVEILRSLGSYWGAANQVADIR
jgi:CheY-like chemotaxis protein